MGTKFWKLQKVQQRWKIKKETKIEKIGKIRIRKIAGERMLFKENWGKKSVIRKKNWLTSKNTGYDK